MAWGREVTAAPSRWSPLAEDVFSPAATATGERTVALFVRSPDGELLYRQGDAGGFGPVRPLGVPVARVEGSAARLPVDWPIAACSTRDGVIHLLARSAEGDLVHGRLRGEEWSGFESVGVPVVEDQHGSSLPMGLAGAPAACCRERGRLEVFAVAGEGNLLHTRWDENGFSACESLGGIGGRPGREGPVFGAISAYDAGLRGMGVVAPGPSGAPRVKRWDGTAWQPFAPLQGLEEIDPLDPALELMRPLTGPPAACGGGATRADVFVRGPRGHLFSAVWDGTRWSAMQALGMPISPATSQPVPFTAGPIACAWGRYRLDVFACAADGRLYRAHCTGSW